ncbi:splicing factor PWI domain-containing protein / RNA recognition motif (RRM)-containing protein [Striga hermonthica]|uniref:Splicing factor PWI domain-containing protein / RNA recognition motif (RRM)-containing protein n=1 Tax=Striga hermonthica TaxID=68872 RepID=A0A9N7R439_STRHE|nr:splicing factor PWI domain-containing protein / RNA recognition motif (RRM)-containing protein [Striga hermonthica]
MADSAPAQETAAAAAVVAEPTTVPDKPESDARPAQPDLSSSAQPPFPYPNPSAPQPPSVLNPSQLPIQPSFRPASPAISVPSAGAAPQFSPGTFQNPGIPHPMLAMASSPTVGSVPQQVQVAAVHPGMAPPYSLPGQPIRYLPPMPNGFPAIPQAVPQGVVRYPYAPMVRPTFPPRPLIGVMPPLARPPVGIRGPVIPHIVPRPPATVATAEEPQTTVYVGKISSTVDNEFILSLLKLCGPVKNWKRPQDPTGTLKGFGFCEFESAEGVLRALRLLNKLSIDGQELMLNVNQTTRKYLERYVEKKTESSKKQSETEGGEKEEASASGATTNETVKPNEESLKPPSDERKKDEDEMNKENSDATTFGLVTDEDRDADREAREKLAGMIEERLKNNPLPPPPPQRPIDGPGNSHSEQPSGSRDEESEGDVAKNNSEDQNEDDKTAESKPMSEFERTDGGSPDRSRRHDRSRDRDRELRREKERELERYEREREQERAKREKDREHRSREDERRYKAREKEWEAREREREHWRKREREREKQKAHERKWEIIDQEHDDDDGYGKKRKYKTSDEERKRRQREKEDDLADRLREEEEIEEAKIRALEEQKKQLEVLKTEEPVNRHENAVLPNESNHGDHFNADQTVDHKLDHGASEVAGEEVLQNGVSDDFVTSSNSDARQSSNLPTRKLGFGLLGSGKRTTVPSVFNEDEDEEAHKDKKMRPLVPIDYSTEEQQVIQPSIPEGPSANIAAAAEYAKRISTASAKEEKPDIEKERNRRSHDRSGHRDRDRTEVETNSTREESRKDNLDRERSNKKTPENQKLLDAKQLIDTIPKTKDELFSYEINWVIYDQNALHERMRPWISKKITDYLGEEEVTLVDYIVSSTQEHVEASEMLERLQTILDDEAEMFVLKMWRMLIFEIKKVETGLAQRSRA